MRTTIPVMEATVDLSQYHAGQMIEHNAAMRAQCRVVRKEYGAFGKPIERLVPIRWQAIHGTVDRSDHSTSEAASPWVGSMYEAERWLTSRGLILGGPYWHAAKEVAEK